jgi:hypothetical protein
MHIEVTDSNRVPDENFKQQTTKQINDGRTKDVLPKNIAK